MTSCSRSDFFSYLYANPCSSPTITMSSHCSRLPEFQTSLKMHHLRLVHFCFPHLSFLKNPQISFPLFFFVKSILTVWDTASSSPVSSHKLLSITLKEPDAYITYPHFSLLLTNLCLGLQPIISMLYLFALQYSHINCQKTSENLLTSSRPSFHYLLSLYTLKFLTVSLLSPLSLTISLTFQLIF